METSRVKYLVSEYRLAKRRLEEVKGGYERIQAAFEISEDLNKELENELTKAKNADNSSSVTYWQDIIDKCFRKDKDNPVPEDLAKAEKEMSEAKEKFVAYYEKKLKIIRKLLGARLTQILENYEEKNILIGETQSAGKLSAKLQEEEEESENERKERDRKSTIGFDKL